MGTQGRYSWFSSSSTTSSLRVWGTVAALAMMRNRESFKSCSSSFTSLPTNFKFRNSTSLVYIFAMLSKLMCHRDGVTSKEYGDSSVEIWKTDGWKWNPISSLSGEFLRQRWLSTYSPLHSPAFPSSIPWIIEHRVLTKTEGMIFRWFLLKAFKSSKQKLRMMHS